MTPGSGSGRALGVDLGAQRIGLALSDPSRTLATPLEVLRRGPDPEHDREAILAAARDTGATMIVVGLPISLSGKFGPAARAALAEIKALHAAAAPDGISVEAHDERFTTVTAERSLGEARVGHDARRNVVDKVAAAVMLQAWLDFQAARA